MMGKVKGQDVTMLVTHSELEKLWDARDTMLKSCTQLGFGEDAQDIIRRIDNKHARLQGAWAKVPDVFQDAFNATKGGGDTNK